MTWKSVQRFAKPMSLKQFAFVAGTFLAVVSLYSLSGFRHGLRKASPSNADGSTTVSISTSAFPDGEEDFLPEVPKVCQRTGGGVEPECGFLKTVTRGCLPVCTDPNLPQLRPGRSRCITSPTIADWTSIKKTGESKRFWPSVVTQRVFDEKDESPRYIADIVGGNVRFDKRDELHFHDWLRETYGEGEPFEEIKRRFRSVLPQDELPVYESCAVVGSAPDLLSYKDGAEIDSFSAVIRTNSAFTEGFEEYVGRKSEFLKPVCIPPHTAAR